MPIAATAQNKPNAGPDGASLGMKTPNICNPTLGLSCRNSTKQASKLTNEKPADAGQLQPIVRFRSPHHSAYPNHSPSFGPINLALAAWRFNVDYNRPSISSRGLLPFKFHRLSTVSVARLTAREQKRSCSPNHSTANLTPCFSGERFVSLHLSIIAALNRVRCKRWF